VTRVLALQKIYRRAYGTQLGVAPAS